jgi:hypothetical protein
MRPSSEGLPLPEGASTIAATPATARAIMSGPPGRVKASYAIAIPRPRDVIKVKEEYLDEFREIWRILGKEFV